MRSSCSPVIDSNYPEANYPEASTVTARPFGARLFLIPRFLTVPLRPPNFGRGTPVHLRKDRIEAAQAAEPRQQCNLDHRQFGTVQKPLRPLHARRPGNLTG